MGWLRRFVRPANKARHWTRWRLPALVLLKLPPDPTSATALRAADPDWHQSPAKSLNPSPNPLALRDGVTRRPLMSGGLLPAPPPAPRDHGSNARVEETARTQSGEEAG